MRIAADDDLGSPLGWAEANGRINRIEWSISEEYSDQTPQTFLGPPHRFLIIAVPMSIGSSTSSRPAARCVPRSEC